MEVMEADKRQDSPSWAPTSAIVWPHAIPRDQWPWLAKTMASSSPHHQEWPRHELGTQVLPLLPLHHMLSVISQHAHGPHLQMHWPAGSFLPFSRTTTGPFFLSATCQHPGQTAPMLMTFSYPNVPSPQCDQFPWLPSHLGIGTPWYWGMAYNNVMIVSSRLHRDSVINIHVSILPQTSLLSRPLRTSSRVPFAVQ